MSIDLSISNSDAMELTNIFFETLKMKCDHLKISKFGTFFYHRSPERIGRNPKTNKSYIIQARSNLKFLTSSNIKATIN